MKRFLITTVVLVCTNLLYAQSQYEISRDPENGSKVLKGIISRYDLVNDTSFGWYAENKKDYVPYPAAVEALKNKGAAIEIIAFMGTWCSDSHIVIPKFYSVLDAAGFPNEKVTLIGTDRSKKTLSHLAEAMNIINVPTIIIMKDGKEMGRVVEYGKVGLFEKDIADILNSL